MLGHKMLFIGQPTDALGFEMQALFSGHRKCAGTTNSCIVSVRKHDPQVAISNEQALSTLGNYWESVFETKLASCA